MIVLEGVIVETNQRPVYPSSATVTLYDGMPRRQMAACLEPTVELYTEIRWHRPASLASCAPPECRLPGILGDIGSTVRVTLEVDPEPAQVIDWGE